MLIPVIIVGLVGLGTYRALRRPQIVGMTAQRVQIYQAALSTLKDPAKLRVLAQAFEDAGCLAEARILKQRAALRELPKEVRLQRRDIISRAFKSSNIEAVRKVAAAFAEQGAVGAAANLNRYADSLVEQAELLKVFSVPLNTTPTVGDDESDEDETDESDEPFEEDDESDTEEMTEDDAIVEALDNTLGQNEVDERESAEEQPPLD